MTGTLPDVTALDSGADHLAGDGFVHGESHDGSLST
jgi:hypothetical protein